MEAIDNSVVNIPEWTQFVRVTVRLLVAAVLGGVVGYERGGKPAGLRTYMLVALGAALFTIAPLESGMDVSDLSRVFQGIATGVGFIGAGTILKLPQEQRIEGLTTATGVWLTAGIGMAAGSGLLWIPILGSLLALVILRLLPYAERPRL
jgi:putative Mg2+ transporter-C (MgtC) family protein